MAKNPMFSFYVNDFEGGTRHMTDAEVGCYIRLLLAQFNSKNGTLPLDENFLQRFSDSFKESWPIVKEKFNQIGNKTIQNERLEKERVKKLIFTQHQSENAKIGAKKRSANAQPTLSHPDANATAKQTPLGYGYGKEKGEKEGMGGKEVLTIPITGFFSDKLDKTIILTEIQVGATIRFIHLTCKVDLLEKDIGDNWEAFKIRQFNIHEWYNSFERLLNHFRNSLKLEIQKNGTHKQIPDSTKHGTSNARVQGIKKLR